MYHVYITDEGDGNGRETVRLLDAHGNFCQDEDDVLYYYFEPDKNVYDGDGVRGVTSCAMTRAEYDYSIRCLREDLARNAQEYDEHLTLDCT